MEATTFLPIGMGLIVLGAGLGIGKFAASAAESIARQPEAAPEITAAVNLPLFLLDVLQLHQQRQPPNRRAYVTLTFPYVNVST